MTTPASKVPPAELVEHTSAKGNTYLTGWLGKARIIGFWVEAEDRDGSPTRVLRLHVQESDHKPQERQEGPRRQRHEVQNHAALKRAPAGGRGGPAATPGRDDQPQRRDLGMKSLAMAHRFVVVALGFPPVCPCPACAADFFRTFARLSDLSGAPASIARAGRLNAELIERAGLMIALGQDVGASVTSLKEAADG
jgi:hypothetical protein